MGKLAVVCAVGAGLLLGGCQAVNTTNGGAVGVERKQYMFSMLSSQQVDQMYAQSYQQDRKSTRLNSSHLKLSRMPSSA